MKVYTRTGDKGQTSLVGGQRVPKHELRVECYGTVDELNSVIGMAISLLPASATEINGELQLIQQQLFDIGSELAHSDDKQCDENWVVTPVWGGQLEQLIDKYSEALPPLRNFILPGGSQSAATLHLMRTVARRAERGVVALQHTATVNPQTVIYLNRLSDLAFVLARVVLQMEGKPEVQWLTAAEREQGLTTPARRRW